MPTPPRPPLPPPIPGTPQRINLNAVLLPTGEVLICGGVVNEADDSSAVLPAELYKPGTNTWVVLPAARAPRNYHSVALLMPDGRVWTAGSNINKQYSFHDGPPSPNDESHFPNSDAPVDHRKLDIEIFEPWYYSRQRPRITSAPSAIGYGDTFEVHATPAETITHAALIRAGSSTHAFDSDQRYLGLTSRHLGGVRLAVTAPPIGSVAPPGYYLLVVLDRDNVP